VRLREGLLAGIVMAALQCAPASAQEAPPSEVERVGQVGAVAIPLAEFEHWFAAATHTRFGRPMELISPSYERCTIAKRKLRAAKGWRKLGGSELRARCARDHRMLRRQAMQFLVQAQWVEQEAAAVGVAVSERRVRQVFERQKRMAFPNERGYRRFLRRSGASEADILYRIRLDTLQNRLTRHVTKNVGPAREQIVLAQFIEGFRKRYRAISWCADGYAIAECGAIAPPS
jgi:foldase protein PrsA